MTTGRRAPRRCSWPPWRASCSGTSPRAPRRRSDKAVAGRSSVQNSCPFRHKSATRAAAPRPSRAAQQHPLVAAPHGVRRAGGGRAAVAHQAAILLPVRADSRRHPPRLAGDQLVVRKRAAAAARSAPVRRVPPAAVGQGEAVGAPGVGCDGGDGVGVVGGELVPRRQRQVIRRLGPQAVVPALTVGAKVRALAAGWGCRACRPRRARRRGCGRRCCCTPPASRCAGVRSAGRSCRMQDLSFC